MSETLELSPYLSYVRRPPKLEGGFPFNWLRDAPAGVQFNSLAELFRSCPFIPHGISQGLYFSLHPLNLLAVIVSNPDEPLAPHITWAVDAKARELCHVALWDRHETLTERLARIAFNSPSDTSLMSSMYVNYLIAALTLALQSTPPVFEPKPLDIHLAFETLCAHGAFRPHSTHLTSLNWLKYFFPNAWWLK